MPPPPCFSAPSLYSPRAHQVAAINNFFENGFKTLFAMATGTGKTLTALFAINDLSFERDVSSLLILVPLQDLVAQWEKDVKKFYSGTIVKVGSAYPRWREELQSHNVSKLFNKEKPIAVISTYESFVKNKKEILKSLTLAACAIIADEVHSFGAEGRKAAMPQDIPYRIGLSATPKRAYDDAGTKAIFDYFCPSQHPFYYTIAEAIAAGYLCRYRYYPIIAELTRAESVDYEAFTESITRLSARRNELSDDEEKKLTLLLKQRHRIIENASGKLPAFEECIAGILEGGAGLGFTIIFCPEGNDAQEEPFIDIFYRALMAAAKRLGKTPPHARKYVEGTNAKTLEDFSRGLIDVLLSKKRLNEGIDIPAIRRAIFISSSTSEREFVQRRGRVLRPAPGKEYAEIFDFVVVPAPNSETSAFSAEMERFYGFIDSAENKAEALIKINNSVRFL